jgi:pimeloyl-ACP methyl ester carboxylesterase
MREEYLRTAPNPGGWPGLIAKGKDSLAEDLDWSKDVAAIRGPTLIVIGDADTVLPSHAVEMFRLLGGAQADWAMGRPFPSQLAILPGTTHFSILSKVDVLLAAICPFLDAPMPPDA